MKKGLILEGGAMRGMFSAGVMDVLMEAGIEVDGIVGVSAGAVFGCNYKSKQIGRTIRYNMKYVRDPRYCSLSSLIKTGDMFGRDFCYNIIPNELDPFDNDTFKNNPVKFYVVATDINSGKALYQRIDSADEKGLEYMRASASMPLVSRPVELDGKEMLDGGIADSIPLEFFVNKGYDKNLVILTQPKDYVKKKNRLIPLMKIKLRKYPRLIEAMANRHILYNNQTKYTENAEKKGSAFVIRPSEKLPIGRLEKNPEILKKVYDLGRAEAMKNLDKIKEYLK
ncbi:MAG: patatin family protein [Ruminococcaceae bacterium]|nr:patatin family protein [Oscillospiraceae bacterium]